MITDIKDQMNKIVTNLTNTKYQHLTFEAKDITKGSTNIPFHKQLIQLCTFR